MDFSLAFILGLLGSLHCAAMCGPLMLALPVPPGGPARVVSGRLVYQFGRIVTYCLLGIVSGLIGKSFFIAGFQRWLSIALGLGVLAGFFVSKRIALSAPVVRLVGSLKRAMSLQLRQRSFHSLILLGMLNGLLPCGLVYVALAGAAAATTAWQGVGSMAAFGLGTSPMLVAIRLSVKMFPLALRNQLRRAIPAGVCLLAGLLILRGLSLGIPYLSPDLTPGKAAACCGR